MTCWIEKQTDVCFIHIPKNAGSSLTSYFHPKYRNMFNLENIEKSSFDVLKINHHSHIDTVVKNIGHRPSYIFSTVRNPWDRMVSWYYYYSKFEPLEHVLEKTKNLPSFNDLKSYYNYWFKGFDSFVLNCLNEEFHEIYRSWNRINDLWYSPTTNQYEWLYRENEVDEFFYVDEIEKCWKMLVEKFQFDPNIEIPFVRKSNRSSYHDYYNERTKQKIFKIFEKDIDFFEFSYGSV